MMALQPIIPGKTASGSAIAAVHPPAVELRDVCVRYDTSNALDHISCSIQPGERIAVVGPNGAGKSTLLKTLVGLQRPSSGTIQLSDSIAYVPQRNQVDWRFPVTVGDVVMMGRVGHIGLFRRPRRRDHELVHAALDMVHLSDLAGRQIGQLSGGQQQRMFLARALAQEARILLLDEPLNGLDVPAQDDLFQMIDQLHAKGVTVITALHDLQIAASRFDRVMLLNRRLVGFGPAGEVLTPARLVETYGSHLHLALTREGVLTVADTCCCDDQPLTR